MMPDAKSNMLKYFALPNWSRISVMLDNGYALSIVFSFSALSINNQ